MEGKLFDAECVFKICNLFGDHINLVAYGFVINEDDDELASDSEEVFN